jgi:WD40 repeat protein
VDWNGPWIAAALGNGQIRRWNTETGAIHDVKIVEDQVVKDVALTSFGAAAALSLDPSGRTEWNWSTGPMPPFPAQIGRRIVWNNDRGLLSVSFQSGPAVTDATGKVWDSLARPSSKYRDLEPTADHTGAVLVDDKGTILRFKWDPDPTIETHAIHVNGYAVAMAHPESPFVAVADPIGVSIWNRDATEPHLLWETPTRPVDVAISPDDRWVAAGLIDGNIWLWELSTGQRVAKLIGHTERVSAIWFSGDGARLLSGSWDETIRLWDLTVLDTPIEALSHVVETRWGRSADRLFELDDGTTAPPTAP